MNNQAFKVDIFTAEKAAVYVSGATWNTTLATLVEQLDAAHVRVVTDVEGMQDDPERVRRVMSECAGLVVIDGDEGNGRVERDLQMGSNLSLPTARVQVGQISTVPATFLESVLKIKSAMPPYAFFIGRLERDFTQAREAIRTAVENEVGVPFLWADDGRHRTNVSSISERTRLLLQHATLVIADLTLGVESPKRENPSRAHEIGLSIAYDRPLLLLSQEPRRYPYFSIADMQMVFWLTEADLHCKLIDWLRTCRDRVGRTTLNYFLTTGKCKPRIAPLEFHFNPKERYIGPSTLQSERASRSR